MIGPYERRLAGHFAAAQNRDNLLAVNHNFEHAMDHYQTIASNAIEDQMQQESFLSREETAEFIYSEIK